jgi:hypothetical protein
VELEEENIPYSSPVITTPLTPPRLVLNRPPSPVSPTPQRRPSSMSSPPKSLSPILHARRLSPSPSPLTLPPRVPSPPADIARQIAAVTRDLADLRAEERRLLQQGVRHYDYNHATARVTEALVDSSLYVSRVHRRLSVTTVLLVPLPSKRFGAYYSSRRNASGCLLRSSDLSGSSD